MMLRILRAAREVLLVVVWIAVALVIAFYLAIVMGAFCCG